MKNLIYILFILFFSVTYGQKPTIQIQNQLIGVWTLVLVENINEVTNTTNGGSISAIVKWKKIQIEKYTYLCNPLSKFFNKKSVGQSTNGLFNCILYLLIPIRKH